MATAPIESLAKLLDLTPRRVQQLAKEGVIPKPATPAVPAVPAKAASGVGLGGTQVWVNTAAKVYHCPGTKYFGKTKKGQYMSEAAARGAGNRADRGAACATR